MKYPRWWLWCLCVGGLFGCAGTPDDDGVSPTPVLTPVPTVRPTEPVTGGTSTPEVTPNPPTATPRPETPTDIPPTPVPVYPALIVSYPSITFFETRVEASTAFVETLTNISLSTRTVLSVDIAGEDAASFSVDDSVLQGPNAVLSPDEAVNLLLIFSPVAIGEQQARLVIVSDDPVQPELTVSLSGVGSGTDLDGDGYFVEVDDCDDLDDHIHPGADEDCDEVDQNCDGDPADTFPDGDLDGVSDCIDRCPGDALDDVDGDTFCGDEDNCPDLSNPSQTDNDDDGVGNSCDDETCDGVDNNGNGVIDEGSPDTDGDLVVDCIDPCPVDALNDDDGDGACGDVDNCLLLSNPDQADVDHNGIGDLCDTERCDGLDNDADGHTDEGFDADEDGTGDCTDDDHDGFSEDGGVGGKKDCNDTQASVKPGVADNSFDGVDTDCDGLVDEDGVSPGMVVITEIFQNPDKVGDDKGEYFEITNMSSHTLDLSGWLLTDNEFDTFTVPASPRITLTSGARLVFGLSKDRAVNGNVPVDVVLTNFRLANTTDSIILSVGTRVIDEVTYDEAGGWPDPVGASMNLDPSRQDAEDNDDALNWCVATSVIAPGYDLGSPGRGEDLCPQFDHDKDGITGLEGDCDDADPLVFPLAWEDPRDGADDNCDGHIDEAPRLVQIFDLWEIVRSESTVGLAWDDAAGTFVVVDAAGDRLHRVSPSGELAGSFAAGYALSTGSMTWVPTLSQFLLVLNDDVSGLTEDAMLPVSANLLNRGTPIKLAFTATNANDTEDPAGLAADPTTSALYMTVCWGLPPIDDVHCSTGMDVVRVSTTGDVLDTITTSSDFADKTTLTLTGGDLGVIPSTGEVLLRVEGSTYIYALDIETGDPSTLLDLSDQGNPTLVEMNPAGDIAVGTDDGFLLLYDMNGDGVWTMTP